jgi:hypothetical protein
MNYQKTYELLINKAVKRALIEDYFEVHHIIPTSLGGTNDKSNLVKLTAREHFIAHCLLARIHGGKQWFAVVMMKSKAKYQFNRYVNAKLYETAKKKSVVEISKIMTGNTYGSFTKGIKRSFESRAAQSKRMIGQKRPLEFRAVMSKALKGVPKPDGFGAEISKRMKGRKQTSEHVAAKVAGQAKNKFKTQQVVKQFAFGYKAQQEKVINNG